MPNLSRTTLLRRQMIDYEGSWRLNPLTKLWARICMHFTWAVRPLLQSWENFHRPHVQGLLCLNPRFSKIRLPIWWLLYTFYAEGHRTELWRAKISQRRSAKEAERHFFLAIAPNETTKRNQRPSAEFLLMCESHLRSWRTKDADFIGFRFRNFKASWSISTVSGNAIPLPRAKVNYLSQRSLFKKSRDYANSAPLQAFYLTSCRD